MSNIEAALMNEDGDELVQRTETLRGAIDDVQAVENAVTEAVGVARSASFEPIVEPLTKMWRLLATYVERRGLAVAAEEAAEEPAAAEAEFAATDEEAALGSTDDVLDRDLTPPAPALDDVRSRDDVIRLLDKICEYYQEHEPSSPVPLLLNRAKRVATMSFLELLRELAPAGLEQAEALGGATDGMGGATDEAIE
jgi:type VI secretion system protein ImpA